MSRKSFSIMIIARCKRANGKNLWLAETENENQLNEANAQGFGTKQCQRIIVMILRQNLKLTSKAIRSWYIIFLYHVDMCAVQTPTFFVCTFTKSKFSFFQHQQCLNDFAKIEPWLFACTSFIIVSCNKFCYASNSLKKIHRKKIAMLYGIRKVLAWSTHDQQ